MKAKIVLWAVIIAFVGVSVCAAEDDADRKGKGWLEKAKEKSHEQSAVAAPKAANIAVPKAANTNKVVVPAPRAAMKTSVTDVKAPRQMAIKNIQPRSAAFREPKFKDMSAAVAPRSAITFKTGTMNVSTNGMQVQHMKKIMRGQVDYAVNTQQ